MRVYLCWPLGPAKFSCLGPWCEADGPLDAQLCLAACNATRVIQCLPSGSADTPSQLGLPELLTDWQGRGSFVAPLPGLRAADCHHQSMTTLAALTTVQLGASP
jgi:hypothetical protein